MGIDPASLSLAAGVVGAGTSAIGTITSGQASASNARYQSQVAANNAIIAEQNANYAAAAGAQRAGTASMRNAARVGAIKAGQAASGIDVNSGSAVDVQRSERESGQLSALTEENNALLQAYGYRAAAVSDTAQSKLLQQEARQATTGSVLAAGGGLLGNASALGYRWNSGTNSGNTGNTWWGEPITDVQS